jgi:phosphoribosyl-AMP cyclohydrolase
MNAQINAKLGDLKLDADGLIPAIIQDAKSKQILMMAWMNREALEKTVETGKTHFYSRSRRKLWLKGESSGHIQTVKSIAKDCDQDVLLVEVEQVGAACHEGYASCFFRKLDAKTGEWEVVGERVFDPAKVYHK